LPNNDLKDNKHNPVAAEGLEWEHEGEAVIGFDVKEARNGKEVKVGI
jgi:hypothetical protein